MEAKPGDVDGLAPTIADVVEIPKEETVKEEIQTQETPKEDAPKEETLKEEKPKEEVQTPETSTVETPEAKTPAVEALKEDTKEPTPEEEAPKVETPAVEAPEVETQKDESKEETVKEAAPTDGDQTLKASVVPHTEDAPDPDEDDLDDLDDMLDQFNLSKPELKAPALASGPGRPQSEPAQPTEGISDEDFAKQLQAGMADLLGEMESSPDMQAQFEKMMKELSGAADLEEPASTASPSKGSDTKDKSAPASTAAAEESFQATIQKTMERMRLSGDNATAAAASSDTDDIMAEMLKAMQGGDLGDGSDEDFSNMILGMMEQLTNKEILYEPMKELDQKFPDWLQKNASKTGKEDLKRYKEQQVYVHEIVGKFEEKTYADSNAADREYIVERMQKMQAAGSPPPDLVGDMAAAQEAFGAPEEGCPQQ